MSAMTVACPHTGREVGTGIETDVNTFSLLPEVPVKFLCAPCGKEHTVNVQKARLSDRPVLDDVARNGFLATLTGVPGFRRLADIV